MNVKCKSHCQGGVREGRRGGRPPSWNQWRPHGELGLTSLLTVIPCPPFPSQWSDVRGGLVESQKCHHCPAVTRSLPTPWGQGGPHVGQYWGTSISPRKRGTTAGLVESWTPSLPQQKWGALSLIRCQQSWVGNMDFYPHLAVMRPHPHAPWQNKVRKSQLKKEGLITPKVSKYPHIPGLNKQTKITHHTKTQEDSNWMEKDNQDDRDVRMIWQRC